LETHLIFLCSFATKLFPAAKNPNLKRGKFMKKAFLICGLLFFVNSICFAQESGNRIYGNQGYSQSKRTPTFGDGALMTSGNGNFQIEASVLMNLKPDSFVAVFGVAQESKTADESNSKVNTQIDDFLKNLIALGITKNDIYVDFITQNKIYDYEVKGDVAEQFLQGFETKKTVAVKYKSRELFEKLSAAATRAQIFDLIKVDYIVSDFESVKSKLFDEAVKVVKQKETRYKTTFEMTMKSVGLSVEKYDAFYPAERYENYQAFESGTAKTTDYSRTAQTTVTLRKSSTFFYEPLGGDKFDKIINPIGIEPTVQFTVFLQVQYKLL
jgi:uncharacterized protein YggE